jgi:nitrogen fixation protein FixH
MGKAFEAHGSQSVPVTEANSPWRWFPFAVAAALVLVFAVNAVMVKLALDTFPGAASGQGFDISNNYDRILARAQQEDALGWRVDVSVAEGQPVVMLAGPAQAAIEAFAERPVGPREHTPLVFEGAGARRISETILAAGQWDVMLTIADNGHVLHTAKRVVVK